MFVPLVPKSYNAKPAVPDDGVTISVRKAVRGSQYAVLTIGKGLSLQMGLSPEKKLDIALGAEKDEGKLRINIADAKGFKVRKHAAGYYSVSLSALPYDLSAVSWHHLKVHHQLVDVTSGKDRLLYITLPTGWRKQDS